ncbi:tetratricopeptide repeat protein [soil metagenome]
MQPDTQERILDALRRQAHDEALGAAREATEESPGDAQAHRLLAMALRASGDHDAARATIEQAIALSPDDADLHFERAGYLLGARQIADAQAALAQSVQLDPNQFGAYILQAQLALGRGDLDEAERQARLAARIVPEHPWLQALEGTLALRRGDPDAALRTLSTAAGQSPDDAQIRYALGFAYLAKGHHAFAEQAFRAVLEQTPDAAGLRGLIAETLQRQGRHAEAADELAPLLGDDRTATPALSRFAGELELMAGRHERALPLLRAALAAEPRDRRALQALVEAWRRSGDLDDARNALEAALATSPEVEDLWRARLMFERVGSDAADAMLARWQGTHPDSMAALEAQLAQHVACGRESEADAVAMQLVEREPGHGIAEMHLIDGKLRRDPAAAVSHVEQLLARAVDDDNRRLLRTWLALAHDRAEQPAQAAALWIALHAEQAAQRLPLPELTAPRTEWPELAPAVEGARGVALLAGTPGSMVERLAVVLDGGVPSFRADRFGAQPPEDALQNFHTPQRLASGETDAAAVADSWRAQLPARGVADGEIIDWLLWWDNALLAVLREQLPHAVLLLAVRDPRDTLLDWLAFGGSAPFSIVSPQAAAAWLAEVHEHIALLHEQTLFRHHLIRLDDIADDPQALTQALSDALPAQLPVPPSDVLGEAHFAPGHWRVYAQSLGDSFALLTPVARRLGYPEH